VTGYQAVGRIADPRDRVQAMLGVRADLTTLDTRELRPWTLGLTDVLRPGYRAMFFGPRGNGKSLAALIGGVQVIEAGGRVTYLDLENGEHRQAERLAAILAGRGPEIARAVSERLDYRSNVRLGALDNRQAVAAWAALFEGCDLVIIDSVARVLGQLGLKENEAADFSCFTTQYVDPVAERGAAVLLLDNTGHEEKNRARGSSAKLDLTELAYRVTAKGIAPDRHGTITLDRVRSRDGDEAERLACGVAEAPTPAWFRSSRAGMRDRSRLPFSRRSRRAGTRLKTRRSGATGSSRPSARPESKVVTPGSATSSPQSSGTQLRKSSATPSAATSPLLSPGRLARPGQLHAQPWATQPPNPAQGTTNLQPQQRVRPGQSLRPGLLPRHPGR
jgi:hypothetical protein